MNKLLFISLIFLVSCSHKNVQKNNFDFSKDISFDEFKIRLNEYAEINPYPNINN
tara:strand:+ start:750 stop:914 length:165 start_codon:yes stop_codon:yes gene_type:complete